MAVLVILVFFFLLQAPDFYVQHMLLLHSLQLKWERVALHVMHWLGNKGFSWQARGESLISCQRAHPTFSQKAGALQWTQNLSHVQQIKLPWGQKTVRILSFSFTSLKQLSVTWTEGPEYVSIESSMLPSIWPHLATRQTSIAITGDRALQRVRQAKIVKKPTAALLK